MMHPSSTECPYARDDPRLWLSPRNHIGAGTEMSEITQRAAYYVPECSDVQIENFKPSNILESLSAEWPEQSYPQLEAHITAHG